MSDNQFINFLRLIILIASISIPSTGIAIHGGLLHLFNNEQELSYTLKHEPLSALVHNSSPLITAVISLIVRAYSRENLASIKSWLLDNSLGSTTASLNILTPSLASHMPTVTRLHKQKPLEFSFHINSPARMTSLGYEGKSTSPTTSFPSSGQHASRRQMGQEDVRKKTKTYGEVSSFISKQLPSREQAGEWLHVVKRQFSGDHSPEEFTQIRFEKRLLEYISTGDHRNVGLLLKKTDSIVSNHPQQALRLLQRYFPKVTPGSTAIPAPKITKEQLKKAIVINWRALMKLEKDLNILHNDLQYLIEWYSANDHSLKEVIEDFDQYYKERDEEVNPLLHVLTLIFHRKDKLNLKTSPQLLALEKSATELLTPPPISTPVTDSTSPKVEIGDISSVETPTILAKKKSPETSEDAGDDLWLDLEKTTWDELTATYEEFKKNPSPELKRKLVNSIKQQDFLSEEKHALTIEILLQTDETQLITHLFVRFIQQPGSSFLYNGQALSQILMQLGRMSLNSNPELGLCYYQLVIGTERTQSSLPAQSFCEKEDAFKKIRRAITRAGIEWSPTEGFPPVKSVDPLVSLFYDLISHGHFSQALSIAFFMFDNITIFQHVLDSEHETIFRYMMLAAYATQPERLSNYTELYSKYYKLPNVLGSNSWFLLTLKDLSLSDKLECYKDSKNIFFIMELEFAKLLYLLNTFSPTASNNLTENNLTENKKELNATFHALWEAIILHSPKLKDSCSEFEKNYYVLAGNMCTLYQANASLLSHWTLTESHFISLTTCDPTEYYKKAQRRLPLGRNDSDAFSIFERRFIEHK